MLEKLKKSWNELRGSEPGRRFKDRYYSHKGQKKGSQVGLVALGIVLIVLGLIMMPAPGPGAIIVVLGLGIIGGEFLPVAKFLDRAELRLRGVYAHLWGDASGGRRMMVAATGLAFFAFGSYGLYQMLGDSELLDRAQALFR